MPSDDEIRAYRALLSAATLLQQVVDRDLRGSAGITYPQFEILSRLADTSRGQRMADLAQGLILSRSGTTYRVQQLEAAGFVRREPDADDERGVIAHLTEAGAAVLALAVPGHLALVQELVFDPLGQTDLTALTRALQAVGDHVTRFLGEDTGRA